MRVSFQINRKTKWSLVGLACFLVGALFISLSNNLPGTQMIISFFGGVLLGFGTVLMLSMIFGMIIEDMEREDDED